MRHVVTLYALLSTAAVAWASSDESVNPLHQPSNSSPPELVSPPIVVFDADRNLLKIDIEKQTLSQVLAKIEQKLDIEFIGREESSEKISVQFDFLPPEAALARLLKGRNYIVEDKVQHDAVRVWILPVGDTADTRPLNAGNKIVADAFYMALQGTKGSEQLAEEVKQLERQLSQQPLWLTDQTSQNPSLQSMATLLNVSLDTAKEAQNTKELVEEFKQLEKQYLQ